MGICSCLWLGNIHGLNSEDGEEIMRIPLVFGFDVPLTNYFFVELLANFFRVFSSPLVNGL